MIISRHRPKALAAALTSLGALGLVPACTAYSTPEAPVASIEDTAPVVAGAATYRERIMAPAGSVLKVTLSDVARADAPARLLDEWIGSLDEGGVPRTFKLRSDTPLDPRMTYAVRATINGPDGALLWTTDTMHRVSPDGSAAIDVGEIVMAKVAPSEPLAPVSRLGGTEWMIVATGGTAIVAGQEPTIRFGEDGRISGFSGCNRFTGGYTEEEDKVTFSPLASTMMACMSNEIGAQERAIQATLSGETTVTIEEPAPGARKLVVKRPNGAGFTGVPIYPKPAGGTPRTDASLFQGAEWIVEEINRTAIIDRSRMTLAFSADGRVSGSGGCNGFSGGYTVAGDTVTFSPMASTRRACISPALSGQEAKYLSALGGEMTWAITPKGALELTGDKGRRVLLQR